MTEQTKPAQEATQNSNEPGFRIQRIYLKDLSLEQPNAPQILLVAAEPVVEIEVDVAVTHLSDEIFEVALIATVTAKVDSKVLFLVEAKQAGIFEFSSIPPEQIDPMLGIACPTILYPELTSNNADTNKPRSFQPIHLKEINLHGMYEQRIMETKAAQAMENKFGY